MRTVIFTIFAALTSAGCQQPERIILEPPAGPVRGLYEDGVIKFLGIPYAESTAAANRWRPPVPKTPWREVRDASKFGPWCPQFDFDRRDEGVVRAGEGWTIFENVPSNRDSHEDCLSINIFAPPLDGRIRPVMVFLHGNALGSSFPLYDGTEMARSGVVFVSINYRLHSMGIFAHASLTEEADTAEPLGRFSELDRLEALRWVQRNIRTFGGDPDQVTLAGQSEGGAAILQMLGHRRGNGLFHRAIVQSGNGWWWPMTHAQHEKLGCRLAEQSGLNGCEATAESLRTIPWPQIPATGPYTIDGRSISTGATQSIDQGTALDVPLLIGWNSFDGSSLRYEPQQVIAHTHADVLEAYDQTQDAESLAYAIYTDLHSGAPARWVAHKLEDGAPVYLYLFSYVVSWEKKSARGAEHGYELPHVFKSFSRQLDDLFPLLSSFLLTDQDHEMSALMHACWVSFVKSGTPTCPGAPAWPPYSRAQDQVMELNLPPTLRKGYRAEQLDAQESHMAYYFERVKKSYAELLSKFSN